MAALCTPSSAGSVRTLPYCFSSASPPTNPSNIDSSAEGGRVELTSDLSSPFGGLKRCGPSLLAPACGGLPTPATPSPRQHGAPSSMMCELKGWAVLCSSLLHAFELVLLTLQVEIPFTPLFDGYRACHRVVRNVGDYPLSLVNVASLTSHMPHQRWSRSSTRSCGIHATIGTPDSGACSRHVCDELG